MCNWKFQKPKPAAVSAVVKCLHHAFDEASVQMNYKHSQEGHLLASVLKDDPWIIGLASKAVGGHHHSQVVYIHLGYSHIRRLGKYLEVMKRQSDLENGKFGTFYSLLSFFFVKLVLACRKLMK